MDCCNKNLGLAIGALGFGVYGVGVYLSWTARKWAVLPTDKKLQWAASFPIMIFGIGLMIAGNKLHHWRNPPRSHKYE